MSLPHPIFDSSFTVTIATPAVFTCRNHGLKEDNQVIFTTDGALPTGLSVNTWYWVIETGLDSDTFRVAATEDGTAINTSGTQSGTHLMASDRHKGLKISIEKQDSCR